MKIEVTNKRCVLFVCLTSTHDDDELVYVCFCMCACPEIFFFCAFKEKGEDAALAAQRRPSRSRLFLIYIFFEKRKTRNVCCRCWSDVGDCCCCFRSFNALLRCPDSFSLQPALLSFSFHRPGFLFFSFLFLSFFFFPLFSLFLLLSPWVMSNLRVLCI